MAVATACTIGTSNKVTVDYQSQEVSVSVTFELERGDSDLQAFVADKAAEVEKAHSSVWRRIREIRAEQKAAQTAASAAQDEATKPAQAPAPAVAAAPQPALQTPAQGDDDPFADPQPRRGRNGRKYTNGASVPEPAPATPPVTAGGGVGAASSGPVQASGPTPASDATDSPKAGTSGNGNGARASTLAPTSVPADVVTFGPGDTAATLAQQRAILSLATRAGMTDQSFLALLHERAGKASVEQLTRQEAARLLVEMQRRDRVPAYPAA